jgi:gamma-glutamylcyclotransferase (GGCT)/AIG2-like uncharacterized protein YtfP
MPEIDHLFVYGTLRRGFGHPMHRVVRDGADAAGHAVAAGTLYDLGPYPGLWPGDTGGPGVRGEVYRLREDHAADTLARLDEYEGIRANEVEGCQYRRVAIEVRVGDASVLAWTYALTALPRDAVVVPAGDYLVWVASRRAPGRFPEDESS